MTFLKNCVYKIYIFFTPTKRESKQPPVIIPREVTPLDLRFNSEE
jgi:hypothetical protein